MTKIVIDGSIASGKSLLLSRLQTETRIPIFLEPISKWTLLEKYYEDPSRWGFAFNTEVLLNMSRWKDNNYDALYERSPVSCRHIFVQMQFEQGEITKEEVDLFDRIAQTFGWEQDVVIYLKTSPEVCFERMKSRNRNCEQTVSMKYLEDVHKKHQDMIKYLTDNKPLIKVYEIDGNEDADTVYNRVSEILNKIAEI